MGATLRPKCCCNNCWVKVSRIFDCDTFAWGAQNAVTKQCTTPSDPLNQWYTATLDNIGCTAFYWRSLGACVSCDAVTIPSADAASLGLPTAVNTDACCDEDPPNDPPPPANGTTCAVDSATYVTCTGFSIDHTCKGVFTCDNTPNPPVNVGNGDARILNGTSGNNWAGFMHPNGVYVVGAAIAWPRVTPGGGAGTLSERQRRAAITWGPGNPTPCGANENFSNTGSDLSVAINCNDPAFDTVHVIINFPYRQNECSPAAAKWAFDTGIVQTAKSNGARKTITLSDADGTPNVFLTNGTVTVSYCC